MCRYIAFYGFVICLSVSFPKFFKPYIGTENIFIRMIDSVQMYEILACKSVVGLIFLSNA